MTSQAFDLYNPGVYEVPVLPDEFGQDGGKFYRCYDGLAEEIDDNMVTGLKEQLDGLLIFAGLFASVNSAFLALTLPLMSPDPADDTNALLRDNNAILLQLALGRNDSIPLTNTLPSETFSPTGKVLTVNILFSVSLTLALISSLMAVLGRQWLVYYRKRSGGGPDRQRWEQLKRFLGAKRWGLEWVLDDFLPSVLQTGLIVFCISLTIYLNTLHPTLSNVVGAFMLAGLAILIFTALLAIWDKFCPFQSPLSHFISWFMGLATTLVRILFLVAADLVGLIYYASVVLTWIMQSLWRRIQSRLAPPRRGTRFRSLVVAAVSPNGRYFHHLARFASLILRKREEDLEELQTNVIRRAMCTSDDALTLLHGVSNILAIRDSHRLNGLAVDEEFTTRLSELWKGSYRRTLQLRGRDQRELATAIRCLYRAAVAHVLLTSTEVPWERTYYLIRSPYYASEKPGILPPRDLFQNSHPNMVNAHLGCIAFDFIFTRRSRSAADPFPPSSTIAVLINPTWRRISILLKIIVGSLSSVRVETREHLIKELHRAYVGDPQTALKDLELVMEESNDRHRSHEGRDILKQYLVIIFKSAGKAAVDGRDNTEAGIRLVAKLLRLSETFVRAEGSPNSFVNIGRSLRRGLIRALASARGRSDLYYRNDPWPDTLRPLIHLFSDLKAASKSPTVSSNQDDLDLASLFSPLLRQLQAETQDSRRRILEGEDGVSQIKQLDRLFRDFKAAVDSVSRAIKRRDRDPELQWCHWQGGNINAMGD
ncbi:hypothetical protein FRC04_004682 [Tulasnella sp. 424]|nr:hypothetical protein FRC04_004682 [Tulasnella sp. 424]